MSQKKAPDTILFCLTLAMLVVGLLMVFDASYARAGQGRSTGQDSLFYLKHQAVFAVAGLFLMFGAMKVRYWTLKGYGKTLLIISIIGLIMVLVPGLGRESQGARRWIAFHGFQIQPSEFAKFGLVIYMASLLSDMKAGIRDLRNGLVWALLPLMPIALLVMKEPDMGTTLIFAFVTLAMIYMAGARKRHVAAIVLIGLVLGSVFAFSASYRRDRMLSFMSPFKYYHGEGYQVCQSLISLGSGGPLGTGIGEGRGKLFYLPAEHTDFIFAVFGEETGFIGSLVLLALFLGVGIRGFSIAFNTKQDFGRFLAGGISMLVCGQAFLNMAVVTSSVPATGVPLPFISYGGSSLVSNLICVGILLGISKNPGSVDSSENENRPNRRRDGRPRVSSNRDRGRSSSRPKTSVLR